MGQKAQITVIMIMVILILLIFGVMYYLTTTSKEKKSEQGLQTQQLAASKIKPVQDYIKSCLDLVSKNSLETMGKQGGYLYRSQGGPITDYSAADIGKKYIVYDNLNVAYSIFPPEGDVAIFTSTPPQYPWESFPIIETSEGKATYFFGFFGYNEMPALEKPFLSSVQEQLEVYTKNNIDKCIDWQAFEKQNLHIKKGEIKTTVTIGETTTVFNMKYPLTITDNSSGVQQNLEEFSVAYNIRLKKIFNFVEYITDHDVTDANFEIAKQTVKDMNTNILRDIFRKDDLVIATDSQSKILDKLFEFRFARHNRIPALHYLDKQAISNNENFGVCVNADLTIVKDTITQLQVNNPQGCGSHPISKEIMLNASDPDEDNQTFKLVIGQERNSYRVKPEDFYLGRFNFRIQVNDGEKFDWQDTSLPMKAVEID